MSISDKVNKYAARLDAIDDKINSLQAEREVIVYNMSLAIGNPATPPTPNKKTAKTTKGTSLGDKITAFLTSNPGKNNASISTAMKVAPNQTALSLMHLAKKSLVFTDEAGNYFVSVPINAAAKTAVVEDDNDL